MSDPVTPSPIVLDYATPKPEDVPDVVFAADKLILEGESPRRICRVFTRRKYGMAYYARAVPRLADEALGADCCHVCGTRDGTLHHLYARWRAQMPAEAFSWSTRSTIEERFGSPHLLCAECHRRWSVRCILTRWIRAVCEHSFVIVFILWIASGVTTASMTGRVMLFVFVLGVVPVALVAGKLAIWYSAPLRIRMFVHRSVACLWISNEQR